MNNFLEIFLNALEHFFITPIMSCVYPRKYKTKENIKQMLKFNDF